MDTRSVSKTERMAGASRILGILSVVLLMIAASILIYARFFLDAVDWVPGIGYVILALLLFFVSLILGLSACITALIALKRNKNDGGDQAIKKMANLGLTLGLVSILVILILWFYRF